MKTLRFGFVVDPADLEAWLAANVAGWSGRVTIDGVDTVVTFADNLDETVVAAQVQAYLADLETGASLLRTRVIQVAQGAVGVQLDQLTANQVRALVAVLLWRAGALTRAGAVRPLNQWAQ